MVLGGWGGEEQEEENSQTESERGKGGQTEQLVAARI